MGTDAYGAHGSETRDYKELGYGSFPPGTADDPTGVRPHPVRRLKVKRPGEKEKLIRLCKVHREEKDVPPISEKEQERKALRLLSRIHLKAMPQR